MATSERDSYSCPDSNSKIEIVFKEHRDERFLDTAFRHGWMDYLEHLGPAKIRHPDLNERSVPSPVGLNRQRNVVACS